MFSRFRKNLFKCTVVDKKNFSGYILIFCYNKPCSNNNEYREKGLSNLVMSIES